MGVTIAHALQVPASASFEQQLKAEQDAAARAMQQLSAGLLAAQDAEREARMRRRQLQSQAVFFTGEPPNSQSLMLTCFLVLFSKIKISLQKKQHEEPQHQALRSTSFLANLRPAPVSGSLLQRSAAFSHADHH